jgi:hypothetical protein
MRLVDLHKVVPNRVEREHVNVVLEMRILFCFAGGAPVPWVLESQEGSSLRALLGIPFLAQRGARVRMCATEALLPNEPDLTERTQLSL